MHLIFFFSIERLGTEKERSAEKKTLIKMCPCIGHGPHAKIKNVQTLALSHELPLEEAASLYFGNKTNHRKKYMIVRVQLSFST